MAYGDNAPFGLQPRVSLTGGAWNNQQNSYQIVSAYNQNLFTGDPVSLGADGTIKLGHDSAGLYCGVFVGCQFTLQVPNASGNVVFSPFWPANQPTLARTTITAFVIDDPSVEYSVQFGGTGFSTNAFAQTMVGDNFPINIGTGSTITGQSGAFLEDTAAGPGPTANFKIIRLEPSINPKQVLGNSFVNVVGVLNSSNFKAPVGNPS